jgi:hypothetical protein
MLHAALCYTTNNSLIEWSLLLLLLLLLLLAQVCSRAG